MNNPRSKRPVPVTIPTDYARASRRRLIRRLSRQYRAAPARISSEVERRAEEAARNARNLAAWRRKMGLLWLANHFPRTGDTP